MVNFEEATLVKGAYVEINGVEYPVHMPEYSGGTQLSPENMNKLQNDLEDKIKANVITVGLIQNQSDLSTGDSQITVGLDIIKYSLGDVFTLQQDGGIKCNVTCDIEINAVLRFGYSPESTKQTYLYRNSEQLIALSQQLATANTQTISAFYMSVNANDVIYLKGRTSGEEKSAFISEGTYMSIKKIN